MWPGDQTKKQKTSLCGTIWVSGHWEAYRWVWGPALVLGLLETERQNKPPFYINFKTTQVTEWTHDMTTSSCATSTSSPSPSSEYTYAFRFHIRGSMVVAGGHGWGKNQCETLFMGNEGAGTGTPIKQRILKEAWAGIIYSVAEVRDR